MQRFSRRISDVLQVTCETDEAHVGFLSYRCRQYATYKIILAVLKNGKLRYLFRLHLVLLAVGFVLRAIKMCNLGAVFVFFHIQLVVAAQGLGSTYTYEKATASVCKTIRIPCKNICPPSSDVPALFFGNELGAKGRKWRSCKKKSPHESLFFFSTSF